MNDEPNVIALREPLPEFPVAIEPDPMKGGNYCSHPTLLLDTRERQVRCRSCSHVLDPFDLLARRASLLHQIAATHDRYQAAAGQVAARVDVLKREEKRLRAMVKRLQDKTMVVVSRDDLTRGEH